MITLKKQHKDRKTLEIHNDSNRDLFFSENLQKISHQNTCTKAYQGEPPTAITRGF